MASDGLTFPQLKVQDIVQLLAQMNIHVKASEIKEPNPMQIRNIYKAILEDMWRLQPTDGLGNQLPFTATEAFEHPELYDGAIHGFLWDSALIKVMHKIGAEDFSLSDIQHPTFKRVKTHLSALLNFFKYFLTIRDEADSLQQEQETTVEDIEKLRDEIEGIEQKITQVAARRDREATQFREVEAEVKRLLEEIMSLNDEQNQIQARIKEQKREAAEATDKLSKLSFEAETQFQERNVVQSQIVGSPDRIKRQIVDKEKMLQDMKQRVTAHQNKLKLLRNKTESFQDCKQALENVTRQLNEGLKYKRASTMSADAVAQLESQALAQKGLLQSLHNNEQQLQRQVQMAKERFSRLSKQQSQKRNQNDHSLSQVRAEREALEMEEKENQTQIERLVEECEDLELLLSELQKEHEQVTLEQKANFNEIVSVIENFDGDLRAMCAQ
ncbi:uncharacterized protein MONBRDRAFT_22893 [Monosiga brevicollis MX1]|uniref:Kinetochore protein Nuf2 n=1 Tax=Monosiga brevicollis TaxID=81824 RepID=A9USD7_MONBE|nr:uncharacterized protein MONBRDRAFT_22893 [Monosiga brevicollis MX1]EDQ92083.1 predicted protein [Monosiga brevicollis MX1]|eukprot:XP_001743369.1 hypothetical protein [Monosiga brevicollis MX1]